jgi:hypothetical protein
MLDDQAHADAGLDEFVPAVRRYCGALRCKSCFSRKRGRGTLSQQVVALPFGLGLTQK